MVIDVQPCPTMEPHLPRPSCHCGSCELGAHTNAVHQTEMLVIYVKWKGRRVMSLTPSSFKTCTLCIPKSHRVKRCQKCDSAQVSVSLSPVLPQILPSPRLTEGSWTNRSEQNWLSKLNTYHEVTGFLRRHCLKHDMRKFSGGCKGTCQIHSQSSFDTNYTCSIQAYKQHSHKPADDQSHTHRQTNTRTDKRTDGQTDRQTNKQSNEHTIYIHCIPFGSIWHDIQLNYITNRKYRQIPASTITYQLLLPLHAATIQYIPPHTAAHSCWHIPVHTNTFRHIPAHSGTGT